MKRLQSPHDAATPELSIVCAVYNAARQLGPFFETYRRHRSLDVELVVVDGGSTDATWDIVQRHADLVSAACSEPDRGIYDAWNKALPMCRGRWVAFIGADDRIADGALDHLVEACRAEPSAHLIAGFNVLTRDGVPVALLGAPYDPRRLVRRMMVAQVLSAHRLSWLRELGGFDAAYRSSGDYELLLRDRGRLSVRTINRVLAYMEDGGTSRRGLLAFRESYRARRTTGCPSWLAAALYLRAIAGRAARIALRRP